MKAISANTILACICEYVPEQIYTYGPIVALQHAFWCNYAGYLWGNKKSAVSMAVAASMERAQGRGKGSRFRRRLSALRAARHGVPLEDWLALERDMRLEMDREEAQQATLAWFEAMECEQVQEAPL